MSANESLIEFADEADNFLRVAELEEFEDEDEEEEDEE